MDRELPADHLARQIVEVLRLLDLTPLWESYTAGGSTAYRPDLMVAIVLYEMRRNRISPGQGYADVHDSRALQWLGFGIRPSRTCWYHFARHRAVSQVLGRGTAVGGGSGETVEPAFGELKTHRGMRRLIGRGLTCVRIQIGLTVLAHNLLVVHRALQTRSTAAQAIQHAREVEV